MPSSAAILAAVTALSPVIIATRSPCACKAAIAAAVAGLTLSATPAIAANVPSTARYKGVRPLSARPNAGLAAASPSGKVTPSRRMNRSAPARTRSPPTCACTPYPGMAAKSVATGITTPAARAARNIAPATGCSDPASTPASSARTWARSNPGITSRSVKSGRPAVSVPVLSNATTATPCKACNASPLRNSTPSSAARPVPTMIDVGVANPIAQGQAMIRTDTPAISACPSVGLGPTHSQTATVRAASPSTAGTNHRVIWSTSP